MGITWGLLEMQMSGPRPRNTESEMRGAGGGGGGRPAAWVSIHPSRASDAHCSLKAVEPWRFQGARHVGWAAGPAYWSESDLGSLGFSFIYPYL